MSNKKSFFFIFTVGTKPSLCSLLPNHLPYYLTIPRFVSYNARMTRCYTRKKVYQIDPRLQRWCHNYKVHNPIKLHLSLSFCFSIFLFFCLSVFPLFTNLFFSLSVFLSVQVKTRVSFCLCVFSPYLLLFFCVLLLFNYLSVPISLSRICLSLSPFHLSTCLNPFQLSVCFHFLFIYLSVYMSISLSFFLWWISLEGA